MDCPQDSRWHPEGDAWAHTLLCMDVCAEQRTGDDLIIGLAVLCHDMGKPDTTIVGDGITSKGHAQAGEKHARSFLSRMTNQQDLIDQVVSLVTSHMRVYDLFRTEVSDKAIRRLANDARIDRLVRVYLADVGGCANETRIQCATDLLQRAQSLDVVDSAPTPLIMGRHLIELGLEPGPKFSEILKPCYEAQLDGEFTTFEGGLDYVRGLL